MSNPRKNNRPFCVLTERCKKEEAEAMKEKSEIAKLKDRIKELEDHNQILMEHVSVLADAISQKTSPGHEHEELRRAFKVMRPAGN